MRPGPVAVVSVRLPSHTNSIRAFPSAFEGLNVVLHLLADMGGDAATHAVGLSAGHGHNGLERGVNGEYSMPLESSLCCPRQSIEICTLLA